MYVDNGKISSRQTFRLYVFDLMGIATLLLPPFLARLCGIDGVFSIVLGTGLGFLYLFYLGWVMKRMGSDACCYLQGQCAPIFRDTVYVLVMIHSIVTAGFCAYVFANLMQYSLVKDSSFGVILSVIVIISAYAVSGGIESRARVYEVLFWFVLIPYVAMMLASIRDFEMVYVDGLFQSEIGDVLSGAYLVFLLLTPLFFSLFLVGEKEKNYGRNMIKTVAASILVSATILLGSYILLVGNFGERALGTMNFPVVTLMSTIQFKGNFLKRMDALMLAVWFFTLFALLNLHLHYGVRMLQELTRGKKKVKDQAKTMKKELALWQVMLPTVLVWIVAYGLKKLANGTELFFDYYCLLAVPFMIVLPAIFLLVRRKKR